VFGAEPFYLPGLKNIPHPAGRVCVAHSIP
jgi:hypothetical protein